MKMLAASLSILAVAAVTGCGSTRPAMDQAAPIVPQNVSYRSGTGVVDNVLFTPAPISSASGGTATGASGHPAGTSATDRPSPAVGAQSNYAGRLVRLAIRMDSGGDIQYIDTDTNEFKKGDRVELTADRLIRKL
jgi:hypothetical protein